MIKQDIINAIEDKRGSTSYSSWTVGVTDDPETRKQQHENDGKNVTYWKHWKTDSEQISRDVESHFLDKGMKGGGGGQGKAGYVYIF